MAAGREPPLGTPSLGWPAVAAGRWVEVGEGVLVRRYQELDLSVGLVIGDGACLVVDTRGDDLQGRELASAVRQVVPDPWSVVITHAHFDHCFGTAAFLPCNLWAHAGCRAVLTDEGEVIRAEAADEYESEGRSDMAIRLREAQLVLPEQLVAATKGLLVGGRPVTLAHLGPGHTNHDLVVHVPDAEVLFAGDLVEEGAPPAFGQDAMPLRWPDAVTALLAMAGDGTVVPGHGKPVDRAFVTAQRDELAVVGELCRAVLDGELGVADAIGRSPYPESVTRDALAARMT
jgi:glyoxylase-like metal-dependent hydrolase (beta-lactamase superfamily II)